MPEKWKLFVAATIVIAATPGPNMLLVMTSSVGNGFRRSFMTMAGCLTDVVAMMAVSAAGLGAVLQAAFLPQFLDTDKSRGPKFAGFALALTLS